MPVFNDKHLSWNWDWAKEMYDTARELGAPLMAGSSLPVTWRTPSLEMPAGARSSAKRCASATAAWTATTSTASKRSSAWWSGAAAARRGVKSVQAYRGENFWKAYKEGVWPRDLMEAALCRSHTLTPAREGFNDIFPTLEDMQRLVKNPVAYRYEHEDGLKSTMLLMSGLVKDFNFAARLRQRAFFPRRCICRCRTGAPRSRISSARW